MISESDGWHLKREEYRAVGDSMANPNARASYESMAVECERRATAIATPRADRTAQECATMADRCDLFAEQFISAGAKRTIGRIADQWRALAALREAPTGPKGKIVP
jgi:hypothetical protein